MLKKENRLLQIQSKSNDQTFNSPLFTIRIASGSGATRFGFVVSKKISKSAVIRNKTKRVLRESARALIEKINSDKNIVIFAKKQLEFNQKDQVSNVLSGLLLKAKIIRL